MVGPFRLSASVSLSVKGAATCLAELTRRPFEPAVIMAGGLSRASYRGPPGFYSFVRPFGQQINI